MMKYVRNLVARAHSKNDGVTALEYALIAALIAVAVIATVRSTGESVDATFDRVNTELAQ